MLKLGKKVNYWAFFWVFFYILVFGFLLRNSFSYLDPDLGWHLKVGQQFVETKTVAHLNSFNYTYSGDWVDHEWLTNLISFEIYSNFGYFSLSIFFALIVLASFILLNVFIRRYYKKISQSTLVFLQLFGLLACSVHFGIRMQEFGFLFLILELWIIKEFSSKQKWSLLFYLLPLFYLWSNMHGSFLLGLAFLISWPIVKVIENQLVLLKSGKFAEYLDLSEKIKQKNIYIFFGFALASLVVTFFTPYGFELYSFLGGYGNTFYLNVIQEWLPQYNFPFNYPQSLYLVLIIFLLVVSFQTALRQKKIKINLWQVFLTVIMLILAVRSRRHFPLLFVVSIPWMTQALTHIFNIKKIPQFSLNKYLRTIILLFVILLGFEQFVLLNVIKQPFANYCGKYPCGATSFLISEEKYNDFNIFNEYNWGGYLIYTYPEKKLFIDGRIPQALYKGHTFLEEYYEFYNAKTDFALKLDEYNIKLVLLKAKDIPLKARRWERFVFDLKDSDLSSVNYLRQYLDGSSNWGKIYQDSTAVIYFKNE